MRLVNRRALVFALAGFGLAACGDDVTVSPAPLQYTVNPASGVQCTTGQPTAVGLSVTGGSGTPTITFTPSGSAITSGTTSGSTFTFTCGNTVGAGSIGFTITSGGQTVTGSIPVTVTQGAGTGTGTAVTAITVNPASATLVPGQSTTITAQVTLAQNAPSGTSTAATFASSDTTVARVVTNANGTATVTAVNSTANVGKQVVITATSSANSNLKAFTTITIAPTSTLVSGLQVSPGSVTLGTGQTQQVTSQVNLAAGAPAGTSTGVTYTSSDTSIVKVSSTGLITAGSKAGTATITVASVAAPGVVQQIGVTVTTPTPVRLTVQSIQQVSAANGLLVPADPSNVQGNLFLTLNLDPGTFTPDSVVASIGGARTVCQRFSIQLAEALRASKTSGSADFAPITCTINTSAFNATTGVASVLNGPQTLNATVYYRPQGGTAAQSQTASVPTQLTINNTSGFFVGVTNTPSAAQLANGAPANGQAVGPQGVVWRGGSITVTVLPVNFTAAGQTGPSAAPINISLIDNGGAGFANRVVATRTATSTSGAATVTFNGDLAASAVAGNNTDWVVNSGAGGNVGDPTQNDLVGYTTPNVTVAPTAAQILAGGQASGTYVVVGGTTLSNGISVLNANGQPVTIPQLNPNPATGNPTLPAGNVAAALFIDNQAPQPVAQANFPTTNFSTSFDLTQNPPTPTRVSGFFNGNSQFTPAAFQFAFDPTIGNGQFCGSIAGNNFTAAGVVSGVPVGQAGLVGTNPDCGGVDRVTYRFFAGTNPTGTGSASSFIGNSSTKEVTLASQLGSLTQNSFYRLAVAEIDALGNRRNQFISQVFNPGTAQATNVPAFFNVDIVAPTLNLLAGANNVSPTNQVFGPKALRTGFNTASNLVPPPQIAFSYSDDIGFGPLPIQMTLARYRRSGTTFTVECLVVDANGNVTPFGAATNINNIGLCTPQLVTGAPIVLPTNVSAVYIGTAQARDQAGNLSAAVPIAAVVDINAPTASSISVSLPQTLSGGSAVTITAGASDDLAVAGGAPRVNYLPASLPTPANVPANAPANTTPNALLYNQTTVLNLSSIFGSLTPTGSGSSSVLPQSQTSMTLTIPSFIRTITGTTAGAPTAGQYGTAQSIQAEIFDLANNSTVNPTAVTIPAGNIPNVPAASPYISATNQVNNITTFNLNVAAGTPASTTPGTVVATNGNGNPTCGPVNVAAACPASATFYVTQTGQANTYVSQLVRIELWVYDPIANGYRFLATVPTGTVTDLPGQPRTITSVVNLPVNTQPYFLAPANGQPANTYQVIALGINGSGDAIASNVVTVDINP